MKTLFIQLLLVFSCVASVNAQEKPSSSFHRYSLGISPSSLLNIRPGIQISQDFGISRTQNIYLETGILFRDHFEYNNIRGYRVELGYQYLLSLKKYSFDLAFGAGLFYRRYRFQRSILTVTNGEWDTLNTTNIGHFTGLDLSLSMLFNLTKRIRLEIGAGTGPAYLRIDEIESSSRFNFGSGPLKYILPVTSFNINFSYGFGYYDS